MLEDGAGSSLLLEGFALPGVGVICSQASFARLGWVHGAVGWHWVQTLVVLPLGPRWQLGADTFPLAWLSWQEGGVFAGG